jgi:DNA-binding transcriptional LysR family regulator
VEIDQIETFLAVVTFGGFNRAAKALRLTQSAVSQRIRTLEDLLGVTLFTRSHACLTLSAAGKVLRPHAEQLLRTVALARQALQELQPANCGALRIAAALSICTYLLPDLIQNYRRAHPEVLIDLRSYKSSQVLKRVIDGEAEVGFARSASHPEVETLTFGDDPLTLVVHAKHPLARKRRIRIEEIEKWPFISYNRGSGDWTIIQTLCRRAGVSPTAVVEVETIETAKRMVEHRLGVCFLPHIAVSRELRRGNLLAIEIVDIQPLHRNLDVIFSRHRPLSRQAREFLAVLGTSAANLIGTQNDHSKKHYGSFFRSMLEL